jgi:hypothetical protein
MSERLFSSYKTPLTDGEPTFVLLMALTVLMVLMTALKLLMTLGCF